MARFDTSGLDDIIKQMEDLGELEGEIAEKMLFAGAEIVRDEWKKSAEACGHKDTGDMIRSITYSRKVKTIKGVKRVDIYPQGKDKKGVRNAEKAFVLNYGTSKKPGSHWVDKADIACAPAVETAMGEIWDNHMKEKGLSD